jgi:hypothetical protein
MAAVIASCAQWALAVFLAGHPNPSRATGVRDKANIDRHEVNEFVQMVALRDGRLLLWTDRGHAYLRDPDGNWTNRIQLPLAHIWALVPDGAGFLASGELPDRTTVVFLFDGRAHELRRWMPAEPRWELVVEGSRHWYVQPTGMIELLPDGRTGPPESFPERPRDRHPGPRVLMHEGARLICYAAGHWLDYHPRASCRRPSGPEWHLEDQYGTPVINCGPYVIAHGRRDEQVVVFSFDGQAVGQRSFPGRPVYACADGETLVVGARRVVQILKLPSLEPVWTRRLDKGKVVMVAAPKGAVAYATDAASAIFVLRR